MNNLTLLRSTTIACGLAAAALMAGCAGMPSAGGSPAFTLGSPDIAAGSTIDNAYVLNGFGCKGQNLSPALVWSNAPAGTKSFAVQVHDPDAPTGSGFWHWSVYNIPASVTSLARGAGNAPAGLPTGANGGHSDFFDTGATGGNGNWGGPARRWGTNRTATSSPCLRSAWTTCTPQRASPRPARRRCTASC